MQAPRYERRKNFMQDNGDQTDHIALNAEFDAVSLSVNGLRQNLTQIQRDDGALQDGIVDADTLSSRFKEDLIRHLSQNIDGRLEESRKAAKQAVASAQAAHRSETQAQQSETATQAASQKAQKAGADAQSSAKEAALSAHTAENAQANALQAADKAATAQHHAAYSSQSAALHAKHAAQSAQSAKTDATLAHQETERASQSMHAAAHSAGEAQRLESIVRQKVDEATQLGTPADSTVSTDKLVDGAVTHAKIQEEAIATDHIRDEAITSTKLGIDAVVEHLGYTPADVEQTWTRANFNPDSKLGNAGDQVLQGPLLLESWLGIKDTKSDAVRGVMHRNGVVGFADQDGEPTLWIDKDDDIWTRKYGYLHNAFVPRSAMTVNGIGSLCMLVQHNAAEGKVVTLPNKPGSWLTLCDSGVGGLRLFVRIA
jgi:chemotaxis protein histidine kinase CheA